MKLSDNEIRDINRYLEEGKPLPDKYRFILFGDNREVELVWNGKTNEVCNVVLPFQTIEQVDEPRSEKEAKLQLDLFDLDNRGRQLKGWTNKLIWGDNKLILSSLKSGPLRDEIEEQGGIKLIYIDPPFDVGADFSMNIEIGNEQFTKSPTVLEELAYRDTWGKGTDSFISMIYERLSLMRDLLSVDGSIYVHCDWRVNSFLRLVMDDLFGTDYFQNEIVWKRATAHNMKTKGYVRTNDSIFYYSKSKKFTFNEQSTPYGKAQMGRYKKDENGKLFKAENLTFSTRNPSRQFDWRGTKPPENRSWGGSLEQLEEWWKQGRILKKKDGSPRMDGLKIYLDETKGGNPLTTIWDDIERIGNTSSERLDYPTQKPETLSERIIKVSSNEHDIVADFFCGSGTTLAAAEKLDRKWIGVDLGKFAIHTTRKRMIETQRSIKKQGKSYRAFELLNLGKYERQFYLSSNQGLSSEQQTVSREGKEKGFAELILRAYRAEKIEGFKTFIGKKSSRLVSVGPINLPVSRLFVEEVVSEAIRNKITKIDILAFEFEMGLFPHVQEEAKSKGVDLGLKYIPRDVFDKRAIEKNQVVFHDVSYIEVKPHVKGKSIAVELTDFSVFYNQDTIANVESSLKNGGTKVCVENGQIIKVSKDKKGIMKRDVLTKKWTDWIDYWAIDFDFESKKEIIRIKEDDVEFKEVWTGDYIFENEWQSFRTKKDRSIELKSAFHECQKGRRKVAVKVVDIFGNDTMKVIEVSV